MENKVLYLLFLESKDELRFMIQSKKSKEHTFLSTKDPRQSFKFLLKMKQVVYAALKNWNK